MRQFLIKSVWFLLPPLAIFAAVEIYISLYPSAVRTKAQFVRQAGDPIEVLILGSSHLDQAINPEWLSMPTANLAYGGQGLVLDRLIYDRYIDELPRLRLLVIGLTYPSLEAEGRSRPWRNTMYWRYHGINNFERRRSAADWFLFLSNPGFYWEWLKNQWLESGNQRRPNRWGFEHRMDGPFASLAHDEAAIEQWAEQQKYGWHPEMNDAAYAHNRTLLKNWIVDARSRGLEVVILNTPAHQTYRDRMLDAKVERRQAFVRELLQRYPGIHDLDFEADPVFDARHFVDESHLNWEGARIFTSLLDAELMAILNADEETKSRFGQ